jgi:hypothetical protein
MHIYDTLKHIKRYIAHNKEMGWDLAQVVNCLSRKHEVLSSNLSSKNKKEVHTKIISR